MNNNYAPLVGDNYAPDKIRVIIPVGGRATRLLPLTAETSKACLRLLNRPLVEFSLLSLASLPPTGGLVGKIFLAAAGVEASLWLLLAALVIGSVIGVFYYLRIVITMFRQSGLTEQVIPPISRSAYLALIVLSVILVILGIYPTPLIQLIERALTGFG